MKISIEKKEYELLRDIEPFATNIKNKLSHTDFSRNVFIMMKYRGENELLSNHIIKTLSERGYNGVRADMSEWNLTEDDVINPLAVLYCCKYGLALFDEPEEGMNYSPNVAYEMGIMHYQHKNCLILIHDTIKDKKPFDLISKMHKTYKRDLEVASIITEWVKNLPVINTSKLKQVAANAEFKIVIGIVRKDKQFLITQRMEKEGKFEWGFPAGIKKNNRKKEKDVIQEECFNETNIQVTAVKKIGERLHPDTGMVCVYWLCDFVSGKIRNKQTHELKEIKWVTGKNAISLIKSDIYDGIKQILES